MQDLRCASREELPFAFETEKFTAVTKCGPPVEYDVGGTLPLNSIEAFESTVNRHFQSFDSNVGGGGRAHLNAYRTQELDALRIYLDQLSKMTPKHFPWHRLNLVAAQ